MGSVEGVSMGRRNGGVCRIRGMSRVAGLLAALYMPQL